MLRVQCAKCGGVEARRVAHQYKTKAGKGTITFHVVPSCNHGKGENND